MTTFERVESPSPHDLQVYGIVVTIVLCFIVFGGVKMINRVAPAFLLPVLFSLFCIFIGVFLTRKDHPAGECIFYVFQFGNWSLSLSLSLSLSIYIYIYIYIYACVCVYYLTSHCSAHDSDAVSLL